MTPPTHFVLRSIGVAAFAGSAACIAHAQAATAATVKPDGQWRSVLGAGYTRTTGNTGASAITFNGEVVRATDRNKWQSYGNALYAKSQGEITGRQVRTGTRFDHNLSPTLFSFVGADLEHDYIALLKLRAGVNTGLGYKFVETPDHSFNVFGGMGYIRDRYDDIRLVDEQLRDRYRYWTVILGEESTHKITSTVSAKQRFAMLPTVNGSGLYRATFDAGLSAALNERMSLTVSFNNRYNSDPGPGVKKTDTLLTTGVSVKFD